MVQNNLKLGHQFSLYPTSSRESAVERTSKGSSAEQASEWAVQANEQADEQVVQ